MDKYSIKMRASQKINGSNIHISGAEKIVSKEQLSAFTNALIERGMNHAKGNADFLNLKIEKTGDRDILRLEALPVTTVEVETLQEGRIEIRNFLRDLEIKNIDEVMNYLEETYAMRGAMLLDIQSMKRREPDYSRGIRATYMDQERPDNSVINEEKNHYEEAVVLATKVIHCPGIIGEICISDDPDYVTGYVSSKKHGYRRITKMKEQGSKNGGRIFLYDSTKAAVDEVIDFLQKQYVIVYGIKELDSQNSDSQESDSQNFDSKKYDSQNPDGQNPDSKIPDSGNPGTPNPVSRWEQLEIKLKMLHDSNLYRTMTTITSPQGSHIVVDGKDIVLMASNSYLDLTVHPYIRRRCREVLDEYGFGSGGSRLTTGNTDLHEKLERKIADFKGCEEAILFNTGYVANVAVISSLMKGDGIIFSDELNHASIIDGCRLSKAKCIIYKHNDMKDLERKIRENPCNNGLVVSDAVFSMDGDILNLPEFMRICNEYELFSMVDEAHSTGVIGEKGHGIAEYFGNSYQPDILMGTLSKSIGGEGGFVAGSKLLVEYLRNTARGFIFSTSLSPVTVAADLAGIELIEREPERVAQLRENVGFFCECLCRYGIEQKSETAIIPIVVGDEKKALELSKYMYDNGYYISAIRYPTVKKGEARLRVALMSTHTKEELSEAASLIGNYMEIIQEII